MESGLEFVAADYPHANRFTIHILAAVAEYESRLNSERMKEAIAARRERGAVTAPSTYKDFRRFPPGCQRASAIVRKARSEARARDLAPLVWKAVGEGKSMTIIAEEFNQSGIAPPAQAPWSKNSIWRIARQTVDEFEQRPPAGKRVGPFVEKSGTAAAFVSTEDGRDIQPGLIDYVTRFTAIAAGEKFNPHVTKGVAAETFLNEMLAEPFKAFTFSPAGASVYQLGTFGSARKKLERLSLGL